MAQREEPHATQRPSPLNRLVRPDGKIDIVWKGRRPHPLDDLYHLLQRSSWKSLVGGIVVAYALLNLAFAVLYELGGPCIENASSFLDHYFFSVQTMATIGYGKMTPATVYANALVTVEALFGLLSLSLATGLMFAKLARPTARVLFSHVAVITRRDGVRSLLFRMCNQRANQISEASLHVVVARGERTLEGERVRRFYDLELVRQTTAVFGLTWTAVHPITEKSPLHGKTVQDLATDGTEIIVSLMGLDETFVAQVHARHSYTADELRFDHRFVDILGTAPDGRRSIDLERFHDTEPFTPPSIDDSST